MNPYTTTELSADLARAGARMTSRTIGVTNTKFLLLEVIKLVAGIPQVQTYVEMNASMNADQKFVWASMGLPTLVKTNPVSTTQPIIVA